MTVGLIHPTMKKEVNIKIYIAVILCSFFVSLNAFAQSQDISVKAELNMNRILIGDQVKLNIQLTVPVGKPVIQWNNLPDTFNHLEVIKRSAVDSSLDGSVKTYNQSITITGFDSGIWVIPPCRIIVDHKEILSDALEITVIPARLTDSTYHSIREIIDVPAPKTPWWYWLAAILTAIALGVLVWLWIRSRKNSKLVFTVGASSISPIEEAMQKLRALREQGLPEKAEWKKYYVGLTDIFRVYIDRRFKSGSLQQTTDELLVQLSPMLPKSSISEIAETLRIADAVKFAKYQSNTEESTSAVVNIEKAIKELDSLKQ
ncbi:MAG TPA: hypothetical protein VFV68_04975 [Agriterribacter sp.]|nr:hypothetical protein [Agriterribacter sp.]